MLSSCGLIEKFKTPENAGNDSQASATDSGTTDIAEASDNSNQVGENPDDLFEDVAAEETNTSDERNVAMETTDPTKEAPGNLNNELKSLEQEFATTTPIEPEKSNTETPPVNAEVMPEIKSDDMAFEEKNLEISSSETHNNSGKAQNYSVKRGETLMQIAFKLYGDISKWKELKDLNSNLLGSSAQLRTGATLKYIAPAKPFKWNPSGTPHLIRTGETLGTISNSYYGSARKWKIIWENNKPMIKNPNLIYAGFTLYCPDKKLGNYVQPEEFQVPKAETVNKFTSKEEEKHTVSEVEVLSANDEDSSPTLMPFKDEEKIDQTIQSLAAPEREENDIVVKVNEEINAEEEKIKIEDIEL